MASTDVYIDEQQRTENNQRMCSVKNLIYYENDRPNLRMKTLGLSPSSFDGDGSGKPRLRSIMYIDATIRLFPENFVMKDGFTSFKADSNGKLVGYAKDPTPIISNGAKSNDRVFLDWIALTEGKLGFGAWSIFEFTRALYDVDVPKWELDFRFTLGHVGSCGVIKKSEAYALRPDEDIPGESTEGRTLLWRNTFHQVLVDAKTRQVARVPAWYDAKYKGKGFLDKPITLRPFKKPAVTFKHEIMVRWSDTDDYGHVNWSSYIRWAEDALHFAMLPVNKHARSSTGALSLFKEEFLKEGLSKLQTAYLRECVEGQLIEIYMWQEKEGPPELVWVSIMQSGEEVNSTKLWYFTKEA